MGRKPNKITAEQILELRKEGYTLKEIAGMLGCSESKLGYTLSGREKKPVTKAVCVVCGVEIEYVGKAVKYACGSDDCQREMSARRNKNRYDAYKPEGSIRPYSYTSNLYIVCALREGMDTTAIAKMFDRDLQNLEEHIQKMRADGTFEKILKQMALYKKENTLRASTALV